MALINCPECNKEISDKAATCPQCGCPVDLPPKKLAPEQVEAKAHKEKFTLSDILWVGAGIIGIVVLVKSVGKANRGHQGHFWADIADGPGGIFKNTTGADWGIIAVAILFLGYLVYRRVRSN